MIKTLKISFVFMFLLIFSGCLNTMKISKVEYMTPHGNELFYYGDNNEFDNYVDEILVFSTLKNTNLIPVIPEIHMEFWVGTASLLYINNDENEFFDLEKMKTKAKWTKVLDKEIKNVRIFKPFETRKILVSRLNMKKPFKKLAENEYVVGYRTDIKCNNSTLEASLNGYIGD